MFSVNQWTRDWQYFGTNPMAIQNEFIERATGVAYVFEALNRVDTQIVFDDGHNKILRYTFENPQDNMYFYFSDWSVDFMVINNNLYHRTPHWHYINDADEHISVYQFTDFHERYVINHRDEWNDYITIYVGYQFYQFDSFYAYTINNDRFEEAADILERNKVHLLSFRENYIEGVIYALDNQIIYTSIPFDEGWRVYVNGDTVETFKIGNALLGFDIPAGDNVIVLRFVPTGIRLGSVISFVSLVTVTTGFIFRKKVLKYFE